jgi:adenosylcobinamide kinase/adenosylcobinamide-phosphate guanylyltransferase
MLILFCEHKKEVFVKILVAGGSKSGKSSLAQSLSSALCRDGLFYLATMAPCDEEDRQRVARHQSERSGLGFITLEKPVAIDECLSDLTAQSTVLIDSLTALLANEMFGGGVDIKAWERAQNGVSQICGGVLNTVIVTDDIFCGAEINDPTTEMFLRGLGHLNRGAADLCDIVVEMSFGTAVFLKGERLFDSLCKKIV